MAGTIHFIFTLFVVFQIKHFIADYPLQLPYMIINKVRPGWGFLMPLATHCFVHSMFTLAICLYVNPAFWYLALLDFAVHFVMDRVKAGPRYLGRFNDLHRSPFWIALGFDQMVHHLTHLYIIWVLVQNTPVA